MDNWIEIIAVVFSLSAVILTTKKIIWCWPIGLVGIIAYAYVFYTIRLYADFSLQFIFIAQSIYGWWFWLKGEKGFEPKISTYEWSNPEKFIKYIIVFLFVSLSYITVSLLFKTYTNAAYPWIDSFVTIGSISANWMLAKKKLESWIIWVIVDIVYIGLFIFKGLYLSAGLYSIFLILAVVGLVNWAKMYEHQQNKDLLLSIYN